MGFDRGEDVSRSGHVGPESGRIGPVGSGAQIPSALAPLIVHTGPRRLRRGPADFVSFFARYWDRDGEQLAPLGSHRHPHKRVGRDSCTACRGPLAGGSDRRLHNDG